jgi:hypothetical protein
MRLPHFDGLAHLIKVQVPVINLCNRTHDPVRMVLDAPKFVVEQALDDMRRATLSAASLVA